MTRRKVVVRPDPEGSVDVESRKLLTLHDGEVGKGIEGALVRYRAKAELPSAEVARRAQQILDWGAAAVRVEQASPEGAALAAVPAPDLQQSADIEPHGNSSFHEGREAVMALAAGVKSVDRETLMQLLDEALTEVGL